MQKKDYSCKGYSYHIGTPGAENCSICGKNLAEIRRAKEEHDMGTKKKKDRRKVQAKQQKNVQIHRLTEEFKQQLQESMKQFQGREIRDVEIHITVHLHAAIDNFTVTLGRNGITKDSVISKRNI